MKNMKITPFSDEAYATIPTIGTRKLRRFLPLQMWRFVVVNIKIMRMIMRSHH